MNPRDQVHIQAQLRLFRLKYYPTRLDAVTKLERGWCLAFTRTWLCCMYETLFGKTGIKYNAQWFDNTLDIISGWNGTRKLLPGEKLDIDELLHILWNMKKTFPGAHIAFSNKLTSAPKTMAADSSLDSKASKKKAVADLVEDKDKESKERKDKEAASPIFLNSESSIVAPMIAEELAFILSRMAHEKRQVEIISYHKDQPLATHDVGLIVNNGYLIVYDPMYSGKEAFFTNFKAAAIELFRIFHYDPHQYAAFGLRFFYGAVNDEEAIMNKNPNIVLELMSQLSYFKRQSPFALDSSQLMRSSLYIAYDYMQAYDAMEYLLQHHADPDASVDPINFTPLVQAAFINDETAVRLLLKYRANVNFGVRDEKDISPPLRMAIEKGHTRVANLLALSGAQLKDTETLSLQLEKSGNSRNTLATLQSAMITAKISSEVVITIPAERKRDASASVVIERNERKLDASPVAQTHAASARADDSHDGPTRVDIAHATAARAETTASNGSALYSLMSSLYHMFKSKTPATQDGNGAAAKSPKFSQSRDEENP